ncbi:MAG: HAD family hydrolase [Roseburia sp.]|nr:HAD family hydrolase [Roseburia sp.]
MEKTLFVTDLDGTLMRNDKSISGKSVTCLKHLIEQGILITYATARSIDSASKLTKDIPFQIPVITRNGTILSNPRTKKEIEIAVFEPDALSMIRQCLKEHEVPGFISSYRNKKETKLYLENRMNTGLQMYLRAHADDKRLRAVPDEDDLYQGEICYFTFIADKADLESLYTSLRGSDKWNCVYQQDKYRPEYWLEICPKSATKAMAVRKIQKQYECEQVVVFGDSLNDISLFEMADEAYAVENAMEELKQLATGVIPSNENDGVAVWLDRRFSSYSSI